MSLFNQAHYYTNYCIFSVVKYYYKGCCIVFKDFMSLVKHDQILSSFNQLPIIARIIVSLVLENVIIRIEIIVFRDFMTLVK